MQYIWKVWISVMLTVSTLLASGGTQNVVAALEESNQGDSSGTGGSSSNSVSGDSSAQLSITVIDYGSEGWGDGAMIESEGECLLMDTYIIDCHDQLVQFLLDNQYTKFAIYLSHYHADHFSNIKPLIRDERFTITHLYLPDPSYMTVTEGDYEDNMSWFKSQAESIPEVAQEYGVPVTYMNTGDKFDVGAASVEILRGPDYEKEDHDRSYLNSNSLVTRVSGGGIRFLTCGDIEKDRERELLGTGLDLKADILKLSHHGGDTSNAVEFLDAVHPLFAYGDYNGDNPETFAADWAHPGMTNAMKTAYVHSVRYNGTIRYTAKNGIIAVTAERNVIPRVVTFFDAKGRVKERAVEWINNEQSRDHDIAGRLRVK